MKRKFLAAKVNINQNIFNDDVEYLISLIPKAILQKPILKKARSKWTWEFTEINKEADAPNILHGYFVKSRNEKKLGKDGEKTFYYDLPYPAAYQSFFLYDSENEILVFEETGDINRDEFINAFSRIIYNARAEIGEIVIEVVPIKQVLYDKILEIEYLTKIEFDLIHPNLVPKDAYKDLSDIIRNEQATRLKTVLENSEGLNKEGNIIQSGLRMVSNGYGKVNAYGFSRVASKKKTKKKFQKFKSRDSVEAVHIDNDADPEHTIGVLKEFALRIRNLLL